jgi:hypothetical protein
VILKIKDITREVKPVSLKSTNVKSKLQDIKFLEKIVPADILLVWTEKTRENIK